MLGAAPTRSDAIDERPLDRLLSGLPEQVQRGIAWLRQPSKRLVRLPLSFLLMFGGFLGFLPILGFWMLPLGLLLLAEDVPAIKRPTMRALGAVQDWWDRRRNRSAR